MQKLMRKLSIFIDLQKFTRRSQHSRAAVCEGKIPNFLATEVVLVYDIISAAVFANCSHSKASGGTKSPQITLQDVALDPCFS